MKKTPSQEAAREYLNDFIVFPMMRNEKWELLHKEYRLWIGKKSRNIVHICKPTKLLHYVNSTGSEYSKAPFVGEITDGSHWHTQKISYRCHACKKSFDGGVALAIRLGIQDKDKFK